MVKCRLSFRSLVLMIILSLRRRWIISNVINNPNCIISSSLRFYSFFKVASLTSLPNTREPVDNLPIQTPVDDLPSRP